ncbi:hypothetical protein C5167_028054 [Papaver somniferum]|nr:hypothetical protein C5167_028054 [Papaver somniferum]
MEKFDPSVMAVARLSVLSAHLITESETTKFQQLSSLKTSQERVLPPPPLHLKGSFTVIDERTGKKYQIQVSENGTIKAADFKKITTGRFDKGLKLYDPGYQNTAPVRSSICYVDGDEGILRYRGYPIEELAESSSFMEVAYLLNNVVHDVQVKDGDNVVQDVPL